MECDVHLEGGIGRAAVPSGASTGEAEALEIRDGESDYYLGKGVRTAIRNIIEFIKPAIMGIEPLDQRELDEALLNLEVDRIRKDKLGANAILAVSMAYARACADAKKVPLYAHLNSDADTLPIPMLNILNGGKHAKNSVDIQEFMIVPGGLPSYREALRAGAEIYHALKNVLAATGLTTNVGDEGGFAPDLASNEAAIEYILEAIQRTGYRSGDQLYLALDAAASSFYDAASGRYRLASEGKDFSAEELIDYYERLVLSYPILSLEDGLAEDDWTHWPLLQQRLGGSVQIVGDDLTVTNPQRLQKAIDTGAMNAILIKLNQIGTLTETLQTVAQAQAAGFGTVVSHRSGETEDTTIADLAVATGVGQIKAGSASRSERVAKYNQLLRIEEALGAEAHYPGMEALPISRSEVSST